MTRTEQKPGVGSMVKFRSHFRQFGMLGGLKTLIFGRLKRVLNSESFRFLELQRTTLLDTEEPPADVEIRALQPDEQDLIHKALRRDARPNETVFVALRDGDVCGFALTQVGGDYSFGAKATMILPGDIVFLKGLVVRPEERGRRIGYFLNQARIAPDHCGDRPVFVSAMSENRAALKNLRKIGFKDTAEITRWSLFGRPVRRTARSMILGQDVPVWIREFDRWS